MQSYYSTIILDPPLHPPTTCTIKCSRRRGITAGLIQLLGAQQHLTPLLKTPFRRSTNSLCEYVCTSQSTKKCLFRPHFATINENPGPLKHCISRPQTAYRKARIKLTPFMFYSFSHQSHLPPTPTTTDPHWHPVLTQAHTQDMLRSAVCTLRCDFSDMVIIIDLPTGVK